ncbi:MAG: DUF1015 domain-containing protein [Candidatus Omnitrophica bacterium]|nr:DUF1015 domain-containing protein [Candidatus Omnitrophota bacterium]
MTAIRPFAALRYNPELVPDLSRVIAPPYDVIGPDEQEQLYQRSPHNIVRLTLGRQSPADSERDNRYTRAGRDFTEWNAQAILRRDAAPALYLVEHVFADGGATRTRLGFIAVIEFDSAAEPSVYRHEATLAAPKADRTKLLEAVPANLEPIFCVYPDAGGAIQARLRRAAAASPTAQTAMNGDSVRLWALTDPERVGAVTRAVSSVPLLIADGHHRFEVAYANRQRYPRLMSYFVSMAEPSLVVRPIHRIVASPGGPSVEALRRLCTIEPARDLASLLEWLAASRAGGTEEGRFGYYDGRTLHRVAVSPETLARWLMAPAVPLPLAKLDVSLLHSLVLPALGTDPSDIRYTADAPEAMQAVDRKEGGAVWLLRGIPLTQVHALAVQGFSLPPKSTYFYPKVPSGLVINPLV